MRQKKGALELSVNTIIIIVIGVTLLSLGLVLVKNIFEEAGGLAEDAFTNARAALEKISGSADEFLTLVPSRTSVDKGKDTGVFVLLTNLGENQLSGLQATLTVQPEYARDITCKFKIDSSTTKAVRTLESVDETSMEVLVRTLDTSTLGTKVCGVQITGPTQGLGDVVGSFSIEIK